MSEESKASIILEMESNWEVENFKTYFGLGLGKFSTPQDKTWISEHAFVPVLMWADANHIPRNHVLLGEFGAMGDSGTQLGNAQASKEAILRAMRENAENAGFSWCTMEMDNYTSGGSAYGISDHTSPYAFTPAAIKGLGLNTEPVKPIVLPKVK